MSWVNLIMLTASIPKVKSLDDSKQGAQEITSVDDLEAFL